MASFKIEGGKSLHGEITPQGAKNEALQILCVCLLTPEKVTISNLPEIRDVQKLIELLQGLGVKIERHTADKISLQADDIDLDHLRSDQFKKQAASIRGSIMIIGPLIARFGKAYIPHPGGDKIGRRRLDTHFIGLQKLGASFTADDTQLIYNITSNGRLKGTYMLLDEASVTGTANIVMAATLAEGTTTIFNAACEPYLMQLCKMLNTMGAKIEGVGSNLLHITGVDRLTGTTHRLLADMIEVGSFIGLAAMTASEITIKNAGISNLGLIPDVFKSSGYRWNSGMMIFTSPNRNIMKLKPLWTAASCISPMHPGRALPPT